MPKMMAGKGGRKFNLKDKKIDIVEKTYIEDEFLNKIEVIAPIEGGENIWAYVRHASGNEYYAARQTQQKVEVIFEINWRDDVDPAVNWIMYKGKEYNITRIDDYEGYKDTLRIYAYAKN